MGLTVVLLIAGSWLFVCYKSNTGKVSADSVVKKLVKLNPGATINNFEPNQNSMYPCSTIIVNIGEEKIFTYEFIDKVAAERAFPAFTDGRDSNMIDYKNNIIIKYNGYNEKVIQQYKELLN
jgi:hypothetical protein